MEEIVGSYRVHSGKIVLNDTTPTSFVSVQCLNTSKSVLFQSSRQGHGRIKITDIEPLPDTIVKTFPDLTVKEKLQIFTNVATQLKAIHLGYALCFVQTCATLGYLIPINDSPVLRH